MKVEVTKEHLEKLIDYCYHEEERHYEEMLDLDESELEVVSDHIFLTIKKLKDEIL